MTRVLKSATMAAALLAAAGQAANAGELTGKFLDGTTWDGQYNIEARQSYVAPTTITFELAPSGKLRGLVKSEFFRRMRTIPAKGEITKGGLLILDFSTGGAERTLKLKLDNGKLVGDAGTLIRGFSGKGRASFKMR